MGSGVNRLDMNGGKGRRRPLVLLFTDIANSTSLASMMEPEDYADLLTELRTALQNVLEHYAGQLIRVDGDGALCIFGMDGGAEHAGKLAALAALAFHVKVAEVARARELKALTMHSGIHAGTVLLRDGDLVRGRYEVIGDATNIAARLCDAAGSQEVLISVDALSSDAGHFALGPQRVVTLQGGEGGKGRRVTAHAVTGLAEAGPMLNDTIFAPTTPLFGRDTELNLARTWLREPSGNAPIFFVQAEAGGGKSRLLAAIADEARASRLRVLHGQCEEDFLAAPLQPMTQLVRELGGDFSPSADLWAMQEAMKLAIVQSAGQSPFLMIIDDWQWADDATKRLVEQTMASAHGHIRLLVASRTHDGVLNGRRPEWTVGLQPLTRSATAALVAALAPQFDGQSAKKIHALSGGNPLLIEELCRDPDFLQSDGADGKVSFRVAAVVERRVAALPPEVVNWLEHLSVCVGALPTWVLAVLVDHPRKAVPDMLQTFADIDFIHQEHRGVPHETLLRFRHALLRQAVQDRMSPDRRRTLHRKIADFLVNRPDLLCIEGRKEKLAHHFLSSDNDQGLHYVLDAGKAAMQAGSIDRALGQYRRSIEFAHRNRHARDEVTILRLANRFGSAALFDPHLEHFGPLHQLSAIAEQQGLSSSKGRLLYWLASLHYATGRPDEAQSVLDLPDFAQMFKIAGLPQELVIALHGQLGVLKAQHRLAARQLNAAISGLEVLADPAYDNSLAYMILMRAQLRGEQGHFADAARDFDHAEQLLQDKEEPLYASILTQKAGVAVWAEDYAKARDYAAAGLNHADRAGSRYYAMLSRALDAVARGHMDGQGEALAELEQCLRWSAQTQSGYTLSLIHSWAAELALRLGDIARADFHAHSCIAQGRHRLFWGAAEAWRVRAALAKDEAKAMRALRNAYTHARRMVSIRDWAATMAAHSAVCARFGDEARADELHHWAITMRSAIGLPVARLRLVAEPDARPHAAKVRASAF